MTCLQDFRHINLATHKAMLAHTFMNADMAELSKMLEHAINNVNLPALNAPKHAVLCVGSCKDYSGRLDNVVAESLI